MPKDNSTFFQQKNDWSRIKDELLRCYLKPYFTKVLRTQRPILYVDCFAGKGRFDDGSDGSPLIAIKIREEVAAGSKAIESCFIDLYHAEDLKANLLPYKQQGVPVGISDGRFEDIIQGLLEKRRNYNVFLYIDPYGIKALDFNLFSAFAQIGSIEMLINMNSFGFIRSACSAMKTTRAFELDESLDDLVEYDTTQDHSIENLNGIAGGTYWQAIINDYNSKIIDGYEAKQRFSVAYKAQLRTKFSYVLDMPIRLKSGHRPKYRMVHVSNHEDGCYLMAENMLKRTDELLDMQLGGQLLLPGFGNEPDYSVVPQKILTCLDSALTGIGLTQLIAMLFTEHGLHWKIDGLRDVLRQMEQEDIIAIERTPPLTKAGKKASFMTETKGQTVIVRRNSP